MSGYRNSGQFPGERNFLNIFIITHLTWPKSAGVFVQKAGHTLMRAWQLFRTPSDQPRLNSLL